MDEFAKEISKISIRCLCKLIDGRRWDIEILLSNRTSIHCQYLLGYEPSCIRIIIINSIKESYLNRKNINMTRIRGRRDEPREREDKLCEEETTIPGHSFVEYN